MNKDRYSKKPINPKFYSKIEVSKGDETLPEGTIFVPYILGEHTEESLQEHRKFMDKYKKEHKCCPKCGETGHTTTLMGYPLIRGEEENYKDLNGCVCTGCKDVHTAHERISKKKFQKGLAS